MSYGSGSEVGGFDGSGYGDGFGGLNGYDNPPAYAQGCEHPQGEPVPGHGGLICYGKPLRDINVPRLLGLRILQMGSQ